MLNLLLLCRNFLETVGALSQEFLSTRLKKSSGIATDISFQTIAISFHYQESGYLHFAVPSAIAGTWLYH